MDHFVDIDVRPDPEFPPHQLMGALYAKLHRALVGQCSADIGVSFPEVDSKRSDLGKRLRLHGERAALSALMASSWLTGMRDHVSLSEPAPVPGTAKHCMVRRVQVKSNPERLRRRLIRRHSLDAQEARERIPDHAARLVKLPFLQLRSSSTGHSFRLFVDHGPPQPHAVAGEFNTFGLSQTATIPWF